MARYSQTASLALFCLVLLGALFAPKQARGDSTPPTSAGDLIASNVHFTLEPTDPTRIASVRFVLASAAPGAHPSSVTISLVSSTTTRYSCQPDAAGWSCQTPDHPTVAAVDQLEISTVTSPTLDPNR
ncbi:MAG TPA: hypothetical protein VER55_04270 [Ardenticatenaceae bacterium]|nr:hypothetical protein [Ardenticatenaceae bacterium]